MTDDLRRVEALRERVADRMAPEPEWDAGEPCGRFLLVEAFSHPESPPLLSLVQVGVVREKVLGEIWLHPADIPDLIRDLQWQWANNYGGDAPQRPWRGRGPPVYMGTDGGPAA